MPDNKNKVTQPPVEDPIDKLLKRVDSGESFAYLKDQSAPLPGYTTKDEMNKYGQSQYDKPLTQQYFENQVGDKQKPFEYQRGAEQSYWDKAANGTLRLAGRALTSGAEGILTPFVGTFYAIADGKFSSFYDNPVSRGLDEADKGIKEALQLYDTRGSENAHGLEKLKYANTLFGDVFDGIGYSLGAIGSGSAYTRFASALAKTAIAGKTSEFIGKISSIEGAADKLKYIDQINKTYRVTDGLKNGTVAFIGATAESSANARSDKNEFKDMMTKELSQNGTRELTDGEKQYIEMLSEKVGNNSFMLNIPTIMLDNWITFGKAVFGNKLTDKGNLLGVSDRVTSEALSEYSLAKRGVIDNILDKTYGLRQAVKPFIAEGTQEQLQYAITKGTNDYYKKRYYNPNAADVIESVSKGLSEAYGTVEGWDNFLIGALSGGIFGNATNLATDRSVYTNPDEALTAKALQTLNSVSSKDSYKTLIQSAMTHANILDEQSKAIENGDDFEYENTKNDLFHNYVSTRLKTGKIEDLYRDLDEFKTMSPEDIKSNFGLELGIDELTGMKQSVSKFVDNKIKQAQSIQRAYNIISERFPNVSEGVKDRLAYAAITIENAKERRNKLSQEVSKIVGDNTYRIGNPSELAALATSYASLTEPAAKELYVENLKNSTVSPMDQDEILKKIADIDKLTKREQDFINEYKELSKPEVQAQLADVDEAAEEEISKATEDIPKETEQTSDIESSEDEGFSPDEDDFVTQMFADEQKKEAQYKLEKDKQDALAKATSDDQKQIITKEYEDKSKELDKRYEVPSDDVDAVSTAVTRVYTKSTTDDTALDKLAAKVSAQIIPDGKSVAAISNVVMIKSFEGSIGITGNFNWKRDKDGLVIPTNTAISLDINNPNVAKVGDKVFFKITKLDDESDKRNKSAIEYSKKEIAASMAEDNPYNYSEADKNFNTPEYTETIGVFTEDGTLIGYVQLPHWINPAKNLKKNFQGLDPKLYEEARKRIIAERKLILDKLSKGEEVSTVVEEKGPGDPLTRLNKDNTPYTSGNLIKETRDKDKFNNRPVFVYDNGAGFTIPGSEELKEEYISFVSKLSSFGQRGKVFQVVKAANGQNGLLSVYTNTFNDENIEKILEAFNTLSDTPSFSEVIQALHPYVFVGNKDTATIKVSGDGANTEFSIANETFSLQDLKSNPYRQGVFSNLLKSKYHNIDVNRINSAPYQKYLADTDVLTTNAYTVEGEYFVQPFIEYKSLLPKDFAVKDIKEGAKKVSDSVINTPDSDLDIDFEKAKKQNRDKGIITDGEIDDDFSRVPQIDPLDRNKVKKFIDTYVPFLTLSDIEEVSKVKGAMIDAVGMYRNSVIYLFEGASTKTGYHEAFHGVFRNMLSNQEKASIIQDAIKKYPVPTRQELDHLIDQFPQEIETSNKQEILDLWASNKYYQEKLADDFADYADTQIDKGLGQKILDFFKRILQWFNIFKNTSRGDIDTLFQNIMAKKYAYKQSPIANQNISHLDEPDYSRPTIGRLKPIVKNDRVKAISNEFVKRYSDILNSGVDLKSISTNDIFKSIYSEYKRLYIEESNKTKPNVKKINVLEEISDHWVEFTEEVRDNLKTSLKINASEFKLEDIPQQLEDESDPETDLEGHTTKSGFGRELTTKSGIESASLRLKILFSTIPIVNKKGTPILDKYGFSQYYSYERIYYWLERHLIGQSNFDDMISQIKKASVFRPELGSVVEMLTADIDGRSEEALKKLQNDFRSNFSKQQMLYQLVLFNKTKAGVEFKLVNSNREGIGSEIFNQWLNNLQVPGTDVITDFSKDPFVVQGTKKAKRLYDKYVPSEQTITAKQLEKVLPKVGIQFSEGVIEKVLESKPDEFKKHIHAVLRFFADDQKDPILEKEGRKSLSELVGYELASALNNYTSSINNVENKAVYTIQNPSWVSKTVAKLTGKESVFEKTLEDLKKDPILKHSNLLEELELDPSYRSKFKILYLNGLRNSKGESLGSKFTKMASEDWLATQIALFQNSTSEQNITSTNTVMYTNVTPADKTLEIIWEGKKYAIVFNNDGTISSSSHIVDKFYNVVLAEANRIKKAREHADTLLPNEFIQYYHFGGDTLQFDSEGKPILDGSAFKFNMIDGLEGQLYNKILAILDKSPDVKKALNPLKNEIKKFLAGKLDEGYKRQTKEAIEKGLIKVVEEDGKKFFKPITIQVEAGSQEDIHNKIKQLFAEFSANTYLANIEYSNLINGDPAFYKSKNGKVTDLPKRFYQGQSMTISINDKDLPEIKVAVVSDLYTASEQESLDVLFKHAKGVSQNYDKSDSINVTDAQVYVTPKLYKELKQARGIWTAEDETAHKVAEGEIEYTSDAEARLSAIKPFIYGTIFNEKLGVSTPIQIKCSIMPLYKSIIKDNPLLSEHRARMEKENVGMLGVESAFKAFLPQRDDINFSGDSYKSIVTVSGEMFGFQVDNPDHMVDEENSSMRQIKMLLPGNIDPNAEYIDKSGKDIIEEIATLESDNITEALEDLNKRTNTAEFNADIADILTSRKATINTQKVLTVNQAGEFDYPIDSINTTASENMLASIFTKRVIKQEYKGGSAVQASAAGFQFKTKYKNIAEQQAGLTSEALKIQSDLAWIRAKDNKSIDYIECAMPAWTKDFFDKDGKLVDINSLPEDIKTMITYRIPTEGYHSMMSIKVVKFLPPEVGNFMILPYEVTKQFGADFDFDKTYFIYRDFYKDKDSKFKTVKYIDGTGSTAIEKRYKNYINKTISQKKHRDLYKDIIVEFQKYYDEPIANLSKNEKIQALMAENKLMTLEEFSELSVSRQNSKEARNNRIIDNYDKVLRSYTTLPYLAKPSGFEELEKLAKKILNTAELANFYEGDTQRFYKDLFHAIIGLKGQSANHVTGHSTFTMLNMTVGEKLAIKFNNKEYSNLSRLKSDSGNLISEELSTMMAAILDAVKNPDLLPSLGINDKTIDIWATLVHYGVGIENAALFTSQPIIKDLSKALKQNEKKIKEIGYKWKDVLDIRSKYVSELDNLLKELPEDFRAKFEEEGFGYKGVLKGYAALTSENLLKYRIHKNEMLAKGDRVEGLDDMKKHAYYLAYQLRVLKTYEKLQPVSDSIVKINRFLGINKEVGPNMENIIEKEYLYNDITAYDFPIDGFYKEKLPQIDANFQAHLDAKDYLSKYIPYASDLYIDIKNTLGRYQYKNDDTTPMLKMDIKDRQLVNGFIKAFMDHQFPEFEKINTMAERKRIFKEIPSMIADIKKSDNDEKYLNGSIRKNPFIDQLKVTFEGGLGFITTKGNRLTDAEKNNIIEAGLELYSRPETKKIFEDLILYSYLSTGFYTGFRSYHPLIPIEVFNTYGASDESESYMDVRRAAIDFIKTAKPLDGGTKDLLIDQLVRNFPKEFTSTFDQDLFLGFETDGKPTTIYAKDEELKNLVVRYEEETDPNRQEAKEVLVYKKYIRVFSNKYNGSLLYRNTSGNEFELISYLGKKGYMIEVNSGEYIESSAIDKNNYRYDTEDATKQTNMFASKKEDEGEIVQDNMSLFDESFEGNEQDETETAALENPDNVTDIPKNNTNMIGFIKKTSEKDDDNFEKGINDLPDIDKC